MAMPFGRLLALAVLEWQEVPFGFVRRSVLALVNDFESDLDQKLSMVQLDHEDEAALYAKQITEVVSGTALMSTRCGSCGRGHFGMTSAVHVLECGHTFHETKTCLPKAVCPVCNPDEHIGEKAEGPVYTIRRSRMRRELT
jgi:hypothetical protein